MTELVAVGFDDPADADRVLASLRRSGCEWLIDLEDAVVASRPGAGEVHLRQGISLAQSAVLGRGLSGAVWGCVVGMVLLHPLAGLAIGSLAGASWQTLSRKLHKYGIAEEFIAATSRTLHHNSSAMFVLIRRAQPDKVIQELSRFGRKVVRAPLSGEHERRLYAAICGVGNDTDAIVKAA